MKDAVNTNFVCARVTSAPAIGGTKMYQVKITCQGKSESMYKTKQDFKNVINMFKLVSAMGARRADHCEVCSSCSTPSVNVRGCDEDVLNSFLNSVLNKLRKCSRENIQKCGTHRGVIQIFMDFLGISNGKYFCEYQEKVSTSPDEVEVSNPIALCSLHRSLSKQFGALDSVC